ncbi:DUF3152 domain-containing protein [Allokutzneria oryzae]|uniref:DUF3152 domain-containing protein n=1 Tax=Allokutzneria oryzae TaxID=1378989 RepID=A0ABV6AAM3_9PSEU
MSTAHLRPRLAGSVCVALVLAVGMSVSACEGPADSVSAPGATSTVSTAPSTTEPVDQFRPIGPAGSLPSMPPVPVPPPPAEGSGSAALPDGPTIPARGEGGWRVVPGTSERVGQGRLYTYTVEIENGVQLPEGDIEFGRAVQATLEDPRSWAGGGRISVRRIDSGTPSVRIRLVSQETARATCGFEIPVDVSCRTSGGVFLSAARWVRGAVAFKGDLAAYRQYMVNHEVGHAFGNGHEVCHADGAAAPVMMQQTFSTANDEVADISAGTNQGTRVPRDGKRCAANAWPFPG